MESSVKFRRARAYLWFWTLIDQQMFRRSKYAPKDYWPCDITMEDQKPFASVQDCNNCCQIPTKKRKDNENEHSQLRQYIGLASNAQSYRKIKQDTTPEVPTTDQLPEVPTPSQTERTSFVKFT